MSKFQTYDAKSIYSIDNFCSQIFNYENSELSEECLLFNIQKTIEELKFIIENKFDENKVISLLRLMINLGDKCNTNKIIEEISKSKLHSIYAKIIEFQLDITDTHEEILIYVFANLSQFTAKSRYGLIGAKNVEFNLLELVLRTFEKLDILTEKNVKDNTSFELYSRLITFLTNNATERANQKMKQIGIVRVLLDHIEKLNKLIELRHEVKYIKVSVIMILVRLLEENEMNRLPIAINSVVTVIECLKETIEQSKTNTKELDGTRYYITYELHNTTTSIRAVEWLRRLNKLSTNDYIKEIIVKLNINDTLECFLQNGTLLEIKRTCELICLLCFNRTFKMCLLNENKKILKHIELILTETNDRSLKADCQQIIEMVNETLEKKISSIKAIASPSVLKSGHIMISYNQLYKNKCLEINSELKKKGFHTWIDAEQPITDLRDSMAKAVENSSIVLICYSNEYKESGNCRYEAEYAANLNKNMIAVRMQYNYKPDGWLGLIISTKLYVDFTGNETLAFNTLFSQIDAVLNNKDEQKNIVPQKTLDICYNDPKRWNNDQVNKWLKDNDLNNLSVILRKYTGITLQSLWQLQKKDYIGFRNLLDAEIAKSKIEVESHELLNFYVLLDRLFDEQTI